ncbi:MFS transporter [Lentibacillus sp. N15]|uniref:MFS transporter n=1 Tax=Lentibacillus songyuanensis TaxID=3136161 RepID=UPI0031BABA65
MKRTKEKLWTWQYILAVGLTFLFFLSLMALLGGFPVYVTEVSNKPASGGLMTTAFMFAAVVSRPIMGMIMHKINMKKCLVLSIVYTFFMVFFCFFSESLPALVVWRALQGLGFGVTTVLLATVVTNVIPNHRLGEGIGYFGMATSIGTTIGPMVALFFIHSVSFYALLIFSLILIVAIFAGALLFNREDMEGEYNDEEPNTSLMRSAFAGKALIPCFMLFLFYITFTGNVNFLDGLGKSVGMESTSLFFFILMLMLLITRPFSGKVYDQKGHKILIYPAAICAIVGLIILANLQNVSTLVIASIFYGLAYGIMQPTLQAWAVSRVHPRNKATANAMALSFMDLGHAVGAVLLGAVISKVGYSSMYQFTAVLGVVLLLVYFVFNMKGRRIRNKHRHATNSAH